MFGREKREKPPSENKEKFIKLQEERLGLIENTPAEKCDNATYDYYNQPDKESFDFIYCISAADRLAYQANTFAREVTYGGLFKGINHYKKLIDDILANIQTVRDLVKQHYGDAKHSRRSPYLSPTSIQHSKNFSEGIKNEHQSYAYIINEDLDRTADGRTSPDIARMQAKQIEDQLREDYNLYISLKKDIESGAIGNIKDLIKSLQEISESTSKVSTRGHERKEAELKKRLAEDEKRAATEQANKPKAKPAEKQSPPHQQEKPYRERPTRETSTPRETVKATEPIFFDELGITLKEYNADISPDKADFVKMMKKKFRELAMIHHPDKAGGDSDKMRRLLEAYDTLSDDTKRKKYLVYWTR